MSVYYLADGLGSTMATTDASGNIVNTFTYDPYGATTSSTGSQPNAFQFAGQATNATGLQYLRARYYDPSTGTFISSDPMGVSPAWPGNPFLYANGNPALLVDPLGLFGWRDIKNGAKAVGSAMGHAVTGCADSNTCRSRVFAGAAVAVGFATANPEAGFLAAGLILAGGNGEECAATHAPAACTEAIVGAASVGIAAAASLGFRASTALSLSPFEAMLQTPSAAVVNACLRYCP
ncbi:RHS repeat-associated core domain-containing protein [bacterium]|nr:RHS repeat-associated core domain-containing protein [bacterium]